MSEAADAPENARVPARRRRRLYFGLEMWLVLEATALVALLLLDFPPMVRAVGAIAALIGLVAVVFLFRHRTRHERGVE